MGLTVAFSVAGITPILIDKQLAPIINRNNHPLVGLATLIVAFIQPFIAYFRPSKDHQFRPLFKLFHTFLGYSCILMAIASVFLTKELQVTRKNKYCILSLTIFLNFRHRTSLTGAIIWWLPSQYGLGCLICPWAATGWSRKERLSQRLQIILLSRLVYSCSALAFWGSQLQ